jgi:hypothetical protein
VKDRVESLLSSASTRLQRLRPWIAANRFWLQIGSLAVLALIASYIIGSSALERAGRYQLDSDRLTATHNGIGRWIDQVQPVFPAESLAWRESDAMLGALAAERMDPASIAQIVAVRAEQIGITDLGIQLLNPDDIPARAPVPAGGWTMSLGGSAVAVQFVGGWPAIISFLGSLPPQVEVGRVEVSATGGILLRADVLLFSRQVAPQ